MKNTIHIYVKILLMLVLTACSDFFNPEQETILSEENAFNDYLSSRSAVNGLYADLQDVMNSYIVTGELRADMLTITDFTTTELEDIYNLEYLATNSYFASRQAYRVISGCNDVAWHLNELLEQGTTYNDELKNMYAETITLRTWVFFYLYRTFGNVPYITVSYTGSETFDIDEWISKNGGTTIQNSQLIEDVNGVIGFYDPDLITNAQFFNLASAYALLGELYLWENNYQMAVEMLTASVETGKGVRFILDKDLENSKWTNIFKGDESATDEIITKVVFSHSEKQENGLVDLFSEIAVEGIQLVPTSKSINLFYGNLRNDGTLNNNSEIAKYTRVADDPYTSDMPVILYRAADVHLMLAEAYNRLQKFDIALDLVNNGSDTLFTAASKGVRGRVGLSSVSLSGGTLADSIQNLEDIIINERAMELAFEGKRWFDLLRIAQRRNNPEYLAEKVMNRFSKPDSAAVRTFFMNSENWFLPFQN